MNKCDKLVTGVSTIVGLAGILTCIALKRNNDCYKAEIKCIEAETNLIKAENDCYKLVNIRNESRIKCLEKELAELKSNKGEA